MKKGFTLAETLITLGIIGIIAATLAPAIRGLTPDRNKTLYLKTYDTIESTVKSLASNSRLYPICNTNANANCSEYPLINTMKPTLDGRYNNDRYSGDTKFCNLIADTLGGNNVDCKDTTYAFNAITFYNYFKDNISFTTPNGMRWMVVPQTSTSVANNKGKFQTDIYVDIDPSTDSNNCIYDENTCTSPDIFKFMIAANGKVEPADPQGNIYLESRLNLQKKDKKITEHQIASLLSTEDREFSYRGCNEGGGFPNGGSQPPPGIETCLAATQPEPTETLTEACGLRFNKYKQEVAGEYITVTLLDGPAASNLTWRPWVKSWDVWNNTVQFYEFSSCDIPVGETTCSVHRDEIRKQEQEHSTAIKWKDLHTIVEGQMVFPKYDHKYIYYTGINHWEYFWDDLWK